MHIILHFKCLKVIKDLLVKNVTVLLLPRGLRGKSTIGVFDNFTSLKAVLKYFSLLFVNQAFKRNGVRLSEFAVIMHLLWHWEWEWTHMSHNLSKSEPWITEFKYGFQIGKLQYTEVFGHPCLEFSAEGAFVCFVLENKLIPLMSLKTMHQKNPNHQNQTNQPKYPIKRANSRLQKASILFIGTDHPCLCSWRGMQQSYQHKHLQFIENNRGVSEALHE